MAELAGDGTTLDAEIGAEETDTTEELAEEITAPCELEATA